jgi:hypothetical protein
MSDTIRLASHLAPTPAPDHSRAHYRRSPASRARLLASALSYPTRSLFEALENRVLFSTEAGELIDLASGDTTGQTEAELLEQQPSTTSANFVGPIQYPATTSSFVGPVQVGSSDVPTESGSSDGSTTAPTRAASDFRYVLKPGNGFTGPTEQPAPVGNPAAAGYDAKSIARWDVVPYQTFDGIFHVGVVAFHMNGIDRVDFSVNGGDWTAVRSMTRNPQTDVYEYTATLNASDYPDGPLEVRAIAWPTVGEPRVLESLPLNTNANGTLPTLVRWVSPAGSDTTGDGSEQNPFATIKKAAFNIRDGQGGKADNGTIYLMAGDYAFAGTTNTAEVKTQSGYLTISAAPGLSPEQVRITAGGSGERLNATLVRLTNLTVAAGLLNTATLSQPSRLWLDGVVSTRYNRFAELTFSGFNLYATDSTFTEVRKGLANVQLARNVEVKHLGEDAFFGPVVLINVTVNDVNRTGWEEWEHILQGAPHPDVVQWNIGAGVTVENRIIYGLRSSNVVGAQGIFIKGGLGSVAKDIALVNVAVQSDNNQWHLATNHLVMWQSAFSYNFIFRDDGLFSGGLVRNVSIGNVVFHNLSGVNNGSASVSIHNNHFVGGMAWGTGSTAGDPGWETLFRPGSNSPLRSRVTELLVGIDAEGTPVKLITGSIGALQPLG